MKKVLLIAVLITSLLSCSKEKENPPTGQLTFINNSNNPYKVFVNDQVVISMQPGKTTQSVYYKAGEVNIKVLQLEGYVLYPTEKTFKGKLVANTTMKTTYP
jgi:hypothetical protein